MITLPGPYKGLKVGLLGGSFNPAHSGHRHVAETAMQRLALDWVWWLVARGNPLKTEHGDYDARIRSARIVACHPRMRVSDLEVQAGLTYSVDTLALLKQRCPGAHFVWLMGGDNLTGFDRWRAWRRIAETVPIAIIARPGAGLAGSVFTTKLSPYRATADQTLAYAAAPAWCYIRAPLNTESSTAIRGAARTVL